MKKIGITTPLIAVFFEFSFSQSKSSLNAANLKGKVKTLIESTYSGLVVFGEVEKGTFKNKRTCKYDLYGNIIEESEYNPDIDPNGRFDYKLISAYDDKGREIECKKYKLDSTFLYKYVYKYDGKSRKIEDNIYDPDSSLKTKYIHKYDSKGNQIETDEYKAEGSLNEKDVFKYDNVGNEIEEKRYNADGSLKYKSTEKHGNKSNLIELRTFDATNNDSTKYTFKYDTEGNEIESKIYDSDGSISQIIDKYDNYDKALEFPQFFNQGTNRVEPGLILYLFFL